VRRLLVLAVEAMKWSADEIPGQAGKLAVVTGATSGPGPVTALELARHGEGIPDAYDPEIGSGVRHP
jgi:hypothetical protein